MPLQNQPHLRKPAGLRLKEVNSVQQLAEKSANRVLAMKAKIKNVGKVNLKQP